MDTQTLHIAGLPVHLFTAADTPPDAPLTILFFLHGRLGQYQDNLRHFQSILTHHAHHKRQCDSSLMLCSFDQRNHGHRHVSERANTTWQDTPGNPLHAQDMHAIQVGTARDVVLLMDYLPAYLTTHTIKRYLCAGISLGGHATWLALQLDTRLIAGIPIIGCPDYLSLMTSRARTLKDGTGGLTEALFPRALREVVERLDPTIHGMREKRLLVLCGARDRLVPYEAGRRFIEALQVEQQHHGGSTEVVVEAGVGHRCSDAMIERLCAFVLAEMHVPQGVRL
ncbi:Alpha/Beta hydrolase protein [Protomyces lactucae-debilis]|uniref:Alpha/Beta hydrolase protein n=1 Tax=Protomyces lactucae-debilis TaxID=2754530 RepID=A0A1Y2EW05_PROLT|nr:Alpha/Beta hydrolase protein [Protomyces lactucae-debilis]ORY75759.1 Alpha/Beta hydrolase protein [Protomyces lactucae-debilis]